MVAIYPSETSSMSPGKSGHVGQIPVRNLWLLMLYASGLMQYVAKDKVAVEENPDDIPDLVAEILARVVERRIGRNLSYGYEEAQSTLRRVRGKIDLLVTERRRLFDKGMVSCRFDSLTVDTPRNRYVRAALESIARIVSRRELGRRCVRLANSLKQLGVIGLKPSRFETETGRVGCVDREDGQMLNLAQLAFNLALPTEERGEWALPKPNREVVWLRHLFEKAIAGFYDIVLSPLGWRVSPGKYLHWQVEDRSSRIDDVLPCMKVDIVLENPAGRRRIVIDTKFNSVCSQNRFGEEVLRSGYLYQMYAYLRSQEREFDALAANCTGVLLHPSTGCTVDEHVVIQGHRMKFVTVDLNATAMDIRNQLVSIVTKCRDDQ